MSSNIYVVHSRNVSLMVSNVMFTRGGLSYVPRLSLLLKNEEPAAEAAAYDEPCGPTNREPNRCGVERDN